MFPVWQVLQRNLMRTLLQSKPGKKRWLGYPLGCGSNFALIPIDSGIRAVTIERY